MVIKKIFSFLLVVTFIATATGCVSTQKNGEKKDPWADFGITMTRLIPLVPGSEQPVNQLLPTEIPVDVQTEIVTVESTEYVYSESEKEYVPGSIIFTESESDTYESVDEGLDTDARSVTLEKDSIEGLMPLFTEDHLKNNNFGLENLWLIKMDFGTRGGTTMQAVTIYNDKTGQWIGPIVKTGETTWARITDGLIGAATYTIPSAVGALILKKGMEHQSDDITFKAGNVTSTSGSTSTSSSKN